MGISYKTRVIIENHFIRIFHCKPSSYGVTPLSGNPHVVTVSSQIKAGACPETPAPAAAATATAADAGGDACDFRGARQDVGHDMT